MAKRALAVVAVLAVALATGAWLLRGEDSGDGEPAQAQPTAPADLQDPRETAPAQEPTDLGPDVVRLQEQRPPALPDEASASPAPRASAPEAPLVPDFAIEGVVLDSETAAPVAEIEVLAYQPERGDDPHAGPWTTATDAAGRFLLRATLAPGPIVFSAHGGQFRAREPLPRASFAGADLRDVRIAVARTPVLRGRVYGADGLGTRAEIELRALDHRADAGATDDAGEFRVGDVLGTLGLSAAAPDTRIDVWASSPGHRLKSSSVALKDLKSELTRIEIRLERGAALSGRVAIPGGEPLPGARLRCYPVRGDGLAMLRETTTGEDGIYGFSGLDPGEHRVEPEPEVAGRVPMLRSAAIVLEVDSDRRGVDFAYGDGFPIAGAVRTKKEEAPLAGRIVQLAHPEWLEPRFTATDHDGRFRFAAVTSGTYRVLLRGTSWSDRRPPQVLEDVPAGRDDVLFEVDEPPEDAVLHLQLRDQASGEPVALPARALLRWSAFGVPFEDLAELAPDARGEAALERLPRTRHRVEVRVAGFAAVRREVLLSDATREAWLELFLQRPLPLFGRVTDPLGRPLEGARVQDVLEVEAGGLLPGAGVATDALGGFELPQAHPEATHLIAAAPGYAAAAVPLASSGRLVTAVTIRLQPGGRVEGRAVHSDGTPARAAILGLAGAVATQYATVGEDGRFAFEAVEDGPFAIGVPDGEWLYQGEVSGRFAPFAEVLVP